MARVFTVSFLYQGQDYTAEVTIKEVHPGSPLSIYVPDPSLHHILPGGRISVDSGAGVPIDTGELTTVQELMGSIMAAIEARESNHNSRT